MSISVEITLDLTWSFGLAAHMSCTFRLMRFARPGNEHDNLALKSAYLPSQMNLVFAPGLVSEGVSALARNKYKECFASCFTPFRNLFRRVFRNLYRNLYRTVLRNPI